MNELKRQDFEKRGQLYVQSIKCYFCFKEHAHQIKTSFSKRVDLYILISNMKLSHWRFKTV